MNWFALQVFVKMEPGLETESRMMIEDWEAGQLYTNCLSRHEGNEAKAVADVRKKYFDDFAKTKDLHFFLGTTQQYHNVAPNPFIIIGTFHPKKFRPDSVARHTKPDTQKLTLQKSLPRTCPTPMDTGL